MSGLVTSYYKECRIFLKCKNQMFNFNLIFILLRYPLEDIPKRIYILKLLYQEKVLSHIIEHKVLTKLMMIANSIHKRFAQKSYPCSQPRGFIKFL